MRFLMMHKVSDSDPWAWTPTPEFVQKMGTYVQGMIEKGVLISGEGVHPSEKGAMVRKTSGGSISSTDGPFTEAKEVIGGFAMINAADRAEAVKIAEEYIALFEDIEIAVEVRQVVEVEDLPS